MEPCPAQIMACDVYIARHPKCNPQSAQGPSVLQSDSIRHPACGTCKLRFGRSELEPRGHNNGLKSRSPKLPSGAFRAIVRASFES
eukprot:5442650-Alexandrium_andersonii.AAC.1